MYETSILVHSRIRGCPVYRGILLNGVGALRHPIIVMTVEQWTPDHYQAVTLTEVRAMNVPKNKLFNMAMVEEVLEQVTYKAGWDLYVGRDSAHGYDVKMYIQVSCPDAICAVSGEPMPYRGAKHYLSKHMCRQELVGKAYGAIKDAEEH